MDRTFVTRSPLNGLAAVAVLALAAGSVFAQSRPEGMRGGGGDRERGPGQFRERGGPGGGGGWGGQFGGMGGIGGFNELFQPDFERRDTALFVVDLKLDKTQQFIVETLVEDYDAAFRKGQEELQAQFSQRMSASSDDPEAQKREAEREQRRQEMRQQFQALRDEMEKLRQEMGDKVDEEKLRQVFREKADALRTQLGDMAPQPQEISNFMKDMSAGVEKWRQEKLRLRNEFITTVQAQLTPEQTGLWPAFDRKLRREKTLARGRQFDGEALDLFSVMRDTTLPEETKAKTDPIMAQYDLELDGALKHRNDVVEQTNKGLYEAMITMDTTRGVDLVQKQVSARVALRDVNLRFVDVLAAEMSEAIAAEFRAKVNERAFSQVYRTTQTQRMFKQAIENPELSAETRASLAAVEQSYLAELAAANQRYAQAIRTHQPQQAIDRTKMIAERLAAGGGFGGFGERNQGPDPIRDELEKRNALGERYQAQLKSMLTPEQFEALSGGRRAEGERRDGRGDGRTNRERATN